MKFCYLLLSFTLLAALTACSPKYNLEIIDARKSLEQESAVYPYFIGEEVLGEVEIIGNLDVDSNNSTQCNFEDQLDRALDITKENGGNGFLIENIELQISNSHLPCANFNGQLLFIRYSHTDVLFAEEDLKRSWILSPESIEGIYEGTGPDGEEIRLAVKKTNQDEYIILYLNGVEEHYSKIWEEGQLKAMLNKTASMQIFKVKWINNSRSINEEYIAQFDYGFMNLVNKKNEYLESFIKVYPTENQMTLGSGTAFAISESGYIVTNYHVIKNSEKIVVKGINSNFSTSMPAEVVLKDEKNDLAILRLTTTDQKPISNIKYAIPQTKNIPVGENIFVLGYPLRATMGDEIKLTNGIISSNSGYQGDITSYQISAPTQPGNSGGPLFDKDGNVVGVVNAKYLNAENVSYAIKISYLNNLLDMLDSEINIPRKNLHSDKSISDQVKLFKDNIYIVTTID